jgi:hypothetical protein
MIRSMVPAETWAELCALLVAVQGDERAVIRVVRKSLPAHALGFVAGGVA